MPSPDRPDPAPSARPEPARRAPRFSILPPADDDAPEEGPAFRSVRARRDGPADD